ncbi:hypothetical protein AURDEDRAFT_131495 [Auricularia subglabra TFB-10046 SS5]|uniref:Uncharacterized protein n=1 Tax=Auricularia subglabra (strain TFB-10046 / SS5) TaxID=717982 RepID=J0CTZ8_AURST|nr:hypothetical protein AURDEDRAFT_131495 [Auricularia subglabra TFB-10046 SS5]
MCAAAREEGLGLPHEVAEADLRALYSLTASPALLGGSPEAEVAAILLPTEPSTPPDSGTMLVQQEAAGPPAPPQEVFEVPGLLDSGCHFITYKYIQIQIDIVILMARHPPCTSPRPDAFSTGNSKDVLKRVEGAQRGISIQFEAPAPANWAGVAHSKSHKCLISSLMRREMEWESTAVAVVHDEPEEK